MYVISTQNHSIQIYFKFLSLKDYEIDQLINTDDYPTNYQTEITTVDVCIFTQNITLSEINKLVLSSLNLELKYSHNKIFK